MSTKPALLGGKAVRTEPYPIHTTMIDEKEEREIVEVLRGGHLSGFSARPGERFLGGPKVQQLEKDFAVHFGVEYAVSFNSATSALHGVVAAAGIGPGDEVVVPPTTMSATASSILMQNAIPVFADIEDATYCLNPDAVADAISPRTKAVLTVNLFGHPSRLDELEALAQKNELVLLEDNAQAPGALQNGRRAGTVGLMGVQSLNYHKGIQTGEGGMVITNDKRCAEHLRLIRNHGEVVIDHMPNRDELGYENMLGWNYRLTELQASIGIPQLKKLDALNAVRVKLAEMLTRELQAFDFLTPPLVRDGCTHSYYLYPLRFHRDRIGLSRETFCKAMQAEGISIGQGYVRPIYLEPMYQKRIVYGARGCPFACPWFEGEVSYEPGRCPVAERLHFDEILTTDICKYPNNEREIHEFVEAVGKISTAVDELQTIEK